MACISADGEPPLLTRDIQTDSNWTPKYCYFLLCVPSWLLEAVMALFLVCDKFVLLKNKRQLWLYLALCFLNPGLYIMHFRPNKFNSNF